MAIRGYRLCSRSGLARTLSPWRSPYLWLDVLAVQMVRAIPRLMWRFLRFDSPWFPLFLTHGVFAVAFLALDSSSINRLESSVFLVPVTNYSSQLHQSHLSHPTPIQPPYQKDGSTTNTPDPQQGGGGQPATIKTVNTLPRHPGTPAK